MRRKVMIATAVTMLVAASAAYAALNNYGASLSFSPSKAGSASHPSALGYTMNLSAANTVAGNRAAPLVDIKTTIYGLVANGKPFATCSDKTIIKPPKYDAACPGGSLVATGPVLAKLGGPDLTQGGTPCKTFLHVYNAGKGKVWFFFITKSAADCGGLTTGQTPPYPGFAKQSGKNLVVDVPLPSFVSTAVAGHQGLYGSLITENLTWKKLSKKVNGKSVAYQASVGCKSGKRPWSVAYTAVASAGGAKETKVVSGSAKC
jgi:hypothetical protein